MSLLSAALRHLKIEPSRLVVVSQGETVALPSIDRGIVFVWATWSGAAQLAFRALNQALSEFPSLDRLRLYVADSDEETTQQFLSEVGETPSGSGETFWVRDGKVHARLKKYGEKELPVIKECTRELLA